MPIKEKHYTTEKVLHNRVLSSQERESFGMLWQYAIFSLPSSGFIVPPTYSTIMKSSSTNYKWTNIWPNITQPCRKELGNMPVKASE